MHNNLRLNSNESEKKKLDLSKCTKGANELEKNKDILAMIHAASTVPKLI